jgi:hypothetical protein
MLTYEIYRFKLTVIIKISSKSVSLSVSIDLKIIVNLIQSDTSKITVQQNKEIFLEPEKYSLYDDGEKLIPNVRINRRNSSLFTYFSLLLFCR